MPEPPCPTRTSLARQWSNWGLHGSSSRAPRVPSQGAWRDLGVLDSHTCCVASRSLLPRSHRHGHLSGRPCSPFIVVVTPLCKGSPLLPDKSGSGTGLANTDPSLKSGGPGHLLLAFRHLFLGRTFAEQLLRSPRGHTAPGTTITATGRPPNL